MYFIVNSIIIALFFSITIKKRCNLEKCEEIQNSKILKKIVKNSKTLIVLTEIIR